MSSFVTIPDNEALPVMINIKKVVSVEITDKGLSQINFTDGNSMTTNLERNILVSLLMRKETEDEQEKKSEPQMVMTPQTWVG